MLSSVSFYSVALISLALLVPRDHAQSTLGSGRLLVQTPVAPVSCAPTTIQWAWSGSSFDAMTHTLSIAVVTEDGYSKRSNGGRALPHAGFIKRRAAIQARDVAIRIAGGSDVPMSDLSWTWSSIGVPPGTYRMALTVIGDGLTGYSAPFAVTSGSDMSCLGLNPSATSTTIPPEVASTSTDTVSSPLQATQTSLSGDSSTGNTDSSTSSSVSSTISTALPSSPISLGSEQSNAHHASSNGGKIAAAVLVPLFAVFVVIALFYIRRKHNANEAAKRRQDWSEKVADSIHREGDTDKGNYGGNARHLRNISEPLDPVHAAGMSQHDDHVRSEMQEVRQDYTPTAAARITSSTGTEHWVDFTGETDACPITSGRLDEIVRASTDQTRTTEHGLYQQGANHALQQEHERQSLGAGNRTVSDSSAASSLPPYLRDVRSPAPSFGQDVDGRPLATHRTSQISMDETIQDCHNVRMGTSSTATRHTEVTRNLMRSASNHSVRRKPVPRVSISTCNDTIPSEGHNPFADNSEDCSDAYHHAPPSTLAQQHLSMQSGRTIADDQLQEMLLSVEQASDEMRTPHQSLRIDAPQNVLSSPSLPPNYDAGSSANPSLVSARSLTGPVDVGMSDAGSPFPDAAHRDAWKLSVCLSGQERGFRVSFPVENEGAAEET